MQRGLRLPLFFFFNLFYLKKELRLFLQDLSTSSLYRLGQIVEGKKKKDDERGDRCGGRGGTIGPKAGYR